MALGNRLIDLRLDGIHNPVGGRIKPISNNESRYIKIGEPARQRQDVIDMCLKCREKTCHGRCLKVMEAEKAHAKRPLNSGNFKPTKTYMYKGKEYTVRELAAMAGMRSIQTMRTRLKLGMSVEEAVERPVKAGRPVKCDVAHDPPILARRKEDADDSRDKDQQP